MLKSQFPGTSERKNKPSIISELASAGNFTSVLAPLHVFLVCVPGGKVGPGCVVWEAGECLAEYLRRQGSDAIRGKRVLELGSGTGVAGICAAALGARVVVTDTAPVLPFLSTNASRHQELVQAHHGSLWAVALDWDQPYPLGGPGPGEAQDPHGPTEGPERPPRGVSKNAAERSPDGGFETPPGSDLEAFPGRGPESTDGSVAEPFPGSDLDTPPGRGLAPAAETMAQTVAGPSRGSDLKPPPGRGPETTALTAEEMVVQPPPGNDVDVPRCGCCHSHRPEGAGGGVSLARESEDQDRNGCGEGSGERGLGGFDLVLGADLVYGMGGISPFLRCLGEVLGRNPGCGVLLAHKHRHANVDEKLFDGLRDLGLDMKAVAADSGSAVKIYSSYSSLTQPEFDNSDGAIG